jgi:hypothetical protein
MLYLKHYTSVADFFYKDWSKFLGGEQLVRQGHNVVAVAPLNQELELPLKVEFKENNSGFL